jgi:hypothetical protein
MGFRLEFFEFDLFLVEVKGTPSATPVASFVPQVSLFDLRTCLQYDTIVNVDFHSEERGAECFALGVVLQGLRSSAS